MVTSNKTQYHTSQLQVDVLTSDTLSQMSNSTTPGINVSTDSSAILETANENVIDLSSDDDIEITNDHTVVQNRDEIVDLTNEKDVPLTHNEDNDSTYWQKTVPVTDKLWRVSSKQSHGTNSTTRFSLSKGVSITKTKRCRVPKTEGEKLELALIGKHFDDVPVIFFSSSLQFAVQLALWMEAKGRTEIRITCICAGTAKTPDRTSVLFHSVQDLIKKWGLELRNEYAGEYVSMSDVVLGQGSCYVSLETLIGNGLYDLYPELSEVNNRKRVKWYSAVRDLRAYCFGREFALTKDEIDVAARLAGCFTPCMNSARGHDGVMISLLASLLSLRKRHGNDATLQTWLHTYTGKQSAANYPGDKAAEAEIPEVKNYYELSGKITGRKFHLNSIQTNPKVDAGVIA